MMMMMMMMMMIVIFIAIVFCQKSAACNLDLSSDDNRRLCICKRCILHSSLRATDTAD